MNWNNLAVFAGMLIIWFGLVRYVLPALGVPTCMSGACRVAPQQSCPLVAPTARDVSLEDTGEKDIAYESEDQAEARPID